MPDWTGYIGTIFCDITETRMLFSAIEAYLILCMFLPQSFSTEMRNLYFNTPLMHMMEDNFSPVCYVTLNDLSHTGRKRVEQQWTWFEYLPFIVVAGVWNLIKKQVQQESCNQIGHNITKWELTLRERPFKNILNVTHFHDLSKGASSPPPHVCHLLWAFISKTSASFTHCRRIAIALLQRQLTLSTF